MQKDTCTSDSSFGGKLAQCPIGCVNVSSGFRYGGLSNVTAWFRLDGLLVVKMKQADLSFTWIRMQLSLDAIFN